MTDKNTAKIRELNDQARKQCQMPTFGECVPCRIYMTRGIAELAPEVQIEIAAKVRNFDDFTPDNDPYGEHDFGSFQHRGHTVNWKIDYYDSAMEQGSENPADPKQTMRVLTIMLANEY